MDFCRKASNLLTISVTTVFTIYMSHNFHDLAPIVLTFADPQSLRFSGAVHVVGDPAGGQFPAGKGPAAAEG